MIDLGQVGWVMMCLGFAAMLALTVFLIHHNDTLTSTNAQLVDLAYTKIDSISDARVAAIHREFDEALRAALTGGGAVAADRFLQRSADK